MLIYRLYSLHARTGIFASEIFVIASTTVKRPARTWLEVVDYYRLKFSILIGRRERLTFCLLRAISLQGSQGSFSSCAQGSLRPSGQSGRSDQAVHRPGRRQF